MEGFAFTSLGRTPEFEGWRCMKPGTGIFAFDLVLTRNGIAMFGDVDGLLFNVGTPAYGIGWLTHHDIGYIHSKLERQCQEREFDLGATKEYVAEWLCTKIANEGRDDLPKWFEDENHWDLHFDDLRAWLNRKSTKSEYVREASFLDDLVSVDNTHDAYKLLDDNTELLGINDLCDISLDRPDQHLTQRLYMVRRAARAILEIKQREAA